MKRFLLVILACACIVCMSACKETPEVPDETLPQATDVPETDAPETDAPETEAPETDAPVSEAPATQPNNVYTLGAFSFEYPSYWEVSDDEVNILIDPQNPGTNITVVSEPAADYTDMEAYRDLLIALYEAMGVSVESVTVESTVNSNGVDVIKTVANCSMQGVGLKQTQFITSLGAKTYIVNVTEMKASDELADMVFNSIYLSYENIETEPLQTEEPTTSEYSVYDAGNITFEYPGSWKVTEGTQVMFMDDKNAGTNMNLTAEAANPYYDILDTQTYIDAVVPIYESMDMTVTNVDVSHVENKNGVKITKIAMDMEYLGVQMDTTQFVVTSGDKTYTITVTEVVEVDGLVERVFDSIKTK